MSYHEKNEYVVFFDAIHRWRVVHGKQVASARVKVGRAIWGFFLEEFRTACGCREVSKHGNAMKVHGHSVILDERLAPMEVVVLENAPF